MSRERRVEVDSGKRETASEIDGKGRRKKRRGRGKVGEENKLDRCLWSGARQLKCTAEVKGWDCGSVNPEDTEKCSKLIKN